MQARNVNFLRLRAIITKLFLIQYCVCLKIENASPERGGQAQNRGGGE